MALNADFSNDVDAYQMSFAFRFCSWHIGSQCIWYSSGISFGRYACRWLFVCLLAKLSICKFLSFLIAPIFTLECWVCILHMISGCYLSDASVIKLVVLLLKFPSLLVSVVVFEYCVFRPMFWQVPWTCSRWCRLFQYGPYDCFYVLLHLIIMMAMTATTVMMIMLMMLTMCVILASAFCHYVFNAFWNALWLRGECFAPLCYRLLDCSVASCSPSWLQSRLT